VGVTSIYVLLFSNLNSNCCADGSGQPVQLVPVHKDLTIMETSQQLSSKSSLLPQMRRVITGMAWVELQWWGCWLINIMYICASICTYMSVYVSNYHGYAYPSLGSFEPIPMYQKCTCTHIHYTQ